MVQLAVMQNIPEWLQNFRMPVHADALKTLKLLETQVESNSRDVSGYAFKVLLPCPFCIG